MRTDVFKAVATREGVTARISVEALYSVEDAVSLDVHDHAEEGDGSRTGVDVMPLYDTSKMKFRLRAGPYSWKDQSILSDIFENNQITLVTQWPIPKYTPTEQ